LKLQVNGEDIIVSSVTLGALLAELDYGQTMIATAVNNELVPQEGRETFPVKDGDRIEILAPMQGG